MKSQQRQQPVEGAREIAEPFKMVINSHTKPHVVKNWISIKQNTGLCVEFNKWDVAWYPALTVANTEC